MCMSEQVITVLGVTGTQGGALDLEAWLRRKRTASRDLDADLVA